MNVAMLMLFNRANISLLKRFERKTLVLAGSIIQVSSAVILSLNAGFNGASLVVTVLFLMTFVGSLGFVFGNIISLVLGLFPKFSATANAVIGVMGFATSSVMGTLAATLLHPELLYPVFVFMIMTAALALSCFLYAKAKISALRIQEV